MSQPYETWTSIMDNSFDAQTLQQPIVQPPAKRLKCEVPGCGKQFNRKEHLTRHFSSHNPQLHHECTICGKRYARSDVLRRHVEHHSQNTSSRRTLVACSSCHEKKLKCDDSIPCLSCTRKHIQCSRLNRQSQPDGHMNTISTLERSDNNESYDHGYHILTDELSNDPELISDHSRSDRTSPWLNLLEDPWELTTSTTPKTYNTNSTKNSSLTNSVQWPMYINYDIAPSTNSSTKSINVEVVKSPQTGVQVASSNSNVSQADTIDSDRPLQSLTSPSIVSQSSQSASLHIDCGSPVATELARCLDKDSPTTKRLIELYFRDIHPIWPILHASTFDVDKVSDLLLGSMVLLASWLDGELDYMRLATHVYDALASSFFKLNFPFKRPIDEASLQNLQALLLCVVYNTSCPTIEGMLPRAIHFTSILTLNCRHLGIFSGQHVYKGSSDNSFDLWKAQEQLHRLAYSTLRMNAYLSLLVDEPPLIRYQEVNIPLPSSNQLWTASTEAQRRKFQWNQPAGREKTLFSWLMHDAMDWDNSNQQAYHLTETDYHLGICTLQNETWEAARAAHSCETDELGSKRTSKDHVHVWRTRLHIWRMNMEADCQIRQKYFSDPVTMPLAEFPSTSNPNQDLVPFTLILWHLSALITHTPLKLLQGEGCCFVCRPDSLTTKRKAEFRLRSWLSTSCPRIGVWNAAQICRVAIQEGVGTPKPPASSLLNPLTIPAVLKSAILVCSYAYYTKACHQCGPVSHSQREELNLFAVESEDSRLVLWTKDLESARAVWGSNGPEICRCRVADFAGWFLKLLQCSKGAEMELKSFLNILGKAI